MRHQKIDAEHLVFMPREEYILYNGEIVGTVEIFPSRTSPRIPRYRAYHRGQPVGEYALFEYAVDALTDRIDEGVAV